MDCCRLLPPSAMQPAASGASQGSISPQRANAVRLAARLHRPKRQHGCSSPRCSAHSFSTGLQVYHLDSPRLDSRGASQDSTSGVVRRASERGVLYLPVFAENKFTFGKIFHHSRLGRGLCPQSYRVSDILARSRERRTPARSWMKSFPSKSGCLSLLRTRLHRPPPR